MNTKMIKIMAICAAGLATGAFAQNSIDSAVGTSSSADSARRYAPGRMGQEVRVSQAMNAQVKSNQGQDLGTINDLIFNPSSGRIDFAVISTTSSSGSASTPKPDSTTSSTTTPADSAATSSSSASGKLVAVPWTLLRSSGVSSSVASAATPSQHAFMFVGDSSKLQTAPSFDQSNWPDISQYTWRQSIYTHFGLTSGSATGGATSPGGIDTSRGSSVPPSPSSPSDSSSQKQQQ